MRPAASLILVLAMPMSLSAQLTVAAPGDSVRVTAPMIWSKVRKGTLVAVRNDSVSFRDAASGDSIATIPIASVSQFEVNRGNKHGESHVWKGAGIGALAGAGIGAIAGAVTYTPPPPCTGFICLNSADTRGLAVVGGAMLGALGGALIGGVLGGTALRGDGYKKVELTQVGLVAVAPRWDAGRRQGGVGVVVRF